MKNYFKALAAFQQECPPLLKSTEGYGYKYVEINTMIAKINPYLAKHKLGFSQPLISHPTTGSLGIKTIIKLSASMLNEVLKGTRETALKTVDSFDLTSKQKETLNNKFR